MFLENIFLRMTKDQEATHTDLPPKLTNLLFLSYFICWFYHWFIWKFSKWKWSPQVIFLPQLNKKVVIFPDVISLIKVFISSISINEEKVLLIDFLGMVGYSRRQYLCNKIRKGNPSSKRITMHLPLYMTQFCKNCLKRPPTTAQIQKHQLIRWDFEDFKWQLYNFISF